MSFWSYVLGISSADWEYDEVLLGIFVLIFATAPACRNHQQICDVQNSTHPKQWAADDISQSYFKNTKQMFHNDQ